MGETDKACAPDKRNVKIWFWDTNLSLVAFTNFLAISLSFVLVNYYPKINKEKRLFFLV